MGLLLPSVSRTVARFSNFLSCTLTHHKQILLASPDFLDETTATQLSEKDVKEGENMTEFLVFGSKRRNGKILGFRSGKLWGFRARRKGRRKGVRGERRSR
jgi:hypothetical protein